MLKHKLIGLPVFCGDIAGPWVMLILTTVEKRSVTGKIEGGAGCSCPRNIEHLSMAVYNTCEAANKMEQKYLDGSLEDASAFFKDMGGFSLSSETVSMKVILPSTHKEKTVSSSQNDDWKSVRTPIPISMLSMKNSAELTVFSSDSMRRGTWS